MNNRNTFIVTLGNIKMGIKEIQIFHQEIERTLLPYLEEHAFQIESKKINESIGSYELILANNHSKSISIDFCMHHLDLFDGVTIKLLKNNNDNPIILNNLSKESKRKIYSQLKPDFTVSEILNDLKKYCNDFISLN